MIGIKSIFLIGALVAVIAAIVAFFGKHKKLATVFAVAGVASAGFAGYDSVKTQKMNALASSEYAAIRFYQALYETTRDEQYKEIADDEARHLSYLQGYGYQATANATQYELTIEGAIQSERDAISAYESALTFVVADATLESDLNRILADENEHLNALITLSIEDQGAKGISGLDLGEIGGIFQTIRDRIESSALIDRIMSVISGVI